VKQMKYVIILGDGMGDYPAAVLRDRTPLAAARKPAMDRLAAQGILGRARTLYEGMPTGSDIANLSVLGYDPRRYYTGRSPVEALGMGVKLSEEDTVFRLNFVTLSSGPEAYEDKTILDHSAGKITNDEAFALLDAVREQLGGDSLRFYPGVSYRHIMVWRGVEYAYSMTPPHDILGKRIGAYLPAGEGPEAQVLSMMKRSYPILCAHPVNQKRMRSGLSPANSIWLWGEGKKPAFESFKEKYGVNGAVITAVPLIMGLAAGMGMVTVPVEGATGEFETNYRGKAEAALEALKNKDFVFIHIEAPDECGHDGQTEQKKQAIERIDENIVAVLRAELDRRGEPYRMMVLPDHYTPLSVRTHTTEPVPFVIFDSRKIQDNPPGFDERMAEKSPLFFEDGYKLMDYFLGR